MGGKQSERTNKQQATPLKNSLTGFPQLQYFWKRFNIDECSVMVCLQLRDTLGDTSRNSMCHFKRHTRAINDNRQSK
jgi:hypothetical protein